MFFKASAFHVDGTLASDDRIGSGYGRSSSALGRLGCGSFSSRDAPSS
jgi:hypothetical protein